jgi:hypothetical protein
MSTRFTLPLAAIIAGAFGGMIPFLDAIGQQQTVTPATRDLRPPSAFVGIADDRARAAALFQEASKVLMHPRCMNCHPATERPKQTDRMRPHEPPVTRGANGHGTPGLPCGTCHGPANFDAARVPGHPEWHLAPASMAWEGRSLGQICEQIKDPVRNGGKDLAALVTHMAEDSLVGWGWSPGKGREPAPGSQATFGQLMRAWADAGAHCPAP